MHYRIASNETLPSYLGRLQLRDIDQILFSNYEFHLRNTSSSITVDPTTGSIVLRERLHRGSRLSYEITAIDASGQTNVTDTLVIDVDGGIDLYEIHISQSVPPGTIVHQLQQDDTTYSLTNESTDFSLDRSTGYIRLMRSIPSARTNYTLLVEARKQNGSSASQIEIFIWITKNDSIYFDLDKTNRCFLDESQSIGTRICTIGKDSTDFLYQLINFKHLFHILSNNGTILNRRRFHYDSDKHQYNVTILVRDQHHQVSRSHSSLQSGHR